MKTYIRKKILVFLSLYYRWLHWNNFEMIGPTNLPEWKSSDKNVLAEKREKKSAGKSGLDSVSSKTCLKCNGVHIKEKNARANKNILGLTAMISSIRIDLRSGQHVFSQKKVYCTKPCNYAAYTITAHLMTWERCRKR